MPGNGIGAKHSNKFSMTDIPVPPRVPTGHEAYGAFFFGTCPHNVYYTARPGPKRMPYESQAAELSKRLPAYTPAQPFLFDIAMLPL